MFVAPDRFAILAGTGARQGTHYARVTVHPGDKRDGCCEGSEGAQVAYMQNASGGRLDENENSGIQQYAFSVKFDPTWKAEYGEWNIFLELHGPNWSNPAWALLAHDKIVLNMRTGDITKNGVKGYELRNGSLNIGKWIDFLLTVKYAKGNTGFVRLARRDEGETSFTEVLNIVDIPTLQFDPNVNGGAVGDHFMLTGLYRKERPFTSILYLDGFTRTAVSE
jgi:Polysaccharide lyase